MKRRSAQIAEKLESEILGGHLPPGVRLPSEEKLCKTYSASRTVIREAIQQLRGRGLLRTEKGSGSFIENPSLESLGSAVQTYSMLAEEADFLDLMDFRILIETECARLAADRAGARVIDNLRKSIGTMQEAMGNRARFSKADITFHLTIAKASGNQIYAILLRSLEERCIDFAQTNRGGDDWYEKVIEHHGRIVDEIEAGHPTQAAETMRRHLLASRRHYVDLQS